MGRENKLQFYAQYIDGVCSYVHMGMHGGEGGIMKTYST